MVGTALRTVPILWGSQFYHEVQYNLHPDEPKIVRYIDDFPESVPANHDYRYPTFLHNLYGLTWWGVGSALDWRSPEESFAGEPSYERALIASRAWQVLLFGLGGMLLVGLAAQRLASRSVVLWAIAATSIQGWVVSSTALVQTDVPAAIGLLGVFWALARIDRSARAEATDGLAPGLWLGAATAMKYTAAIGAVGIVLSAWWAYRRGAASLRTAAGLVGVGALAGAGAFLLFVPGALFDSHHFWLSIQYEFQGKAVGETFAWSKFSRGWLGCMPLWITIPAVLGAGWYAVQARTRTWLSIAISLALYVLITAPSFREDYAIPLMPFAALSSGYLLARLAQRHPLWRSAAVLYLLAASLHVAWTVVERYRADTRYRFDAWVHEHIQPGPLGDGPNPLRRSWSAPNLPTGYQWVSVHEQPEWVVLCERHYEPLLNVLADPLHYEALGVVFDPKERKLLALGDRDFRFYEDVLLGEDRDFHYDLVEHFAPSRAPLDMQGLDVKVYRRRDVSNESR